MWWLILAGPSDLGHLCLTMATPSSLHITLGTQTQRRPAHSHSTEETSTKHRRVIWDREMAMESELLAAEHSRKELSAHSFSLVTQYLHNIYTISTQHLHSIYTISTQYLHSIYTISTQYLHSIYTVSTQYLHTWWLRTGWGTSLPWPEVWIVCSHCVYHAPFGLSIQN